MDTLPKDVLTDLLAGITEKLARDTVVTAVFVSVDKTHGTTFYQVGDPFIAIGPLTVSLDKLRRQAQDILRDDDIRNLVKHAQERAMDEILGHPDANDITGAGV